MNDNEPADCSAEFVQLLAASEHCLSGFVLSLVPNWSDAEEIIQETKLRLWQQFSTYDRKKNFGTWACVIARYEVLSFRTRAGRSRVQFSQAFIDRVADEVSQTAEEADSRVGFLHECFKKLTQWQRDLVWRCCVEGESTKSVADQTGRQDEAIRKSLLRARRKLFRCIQAAKRKEEQSG